MRVEGNTCVSNLRAPLANRVIIPCNDLDHDPTPPQYKSTEKKNSWHIHSDITVEKEWSALVKGYELILKDNTMKDNGIQFDQDSIRRMEISSSVRETKKAGTDAIEQRSVNFPDGDSLLVINHFLFDFGQGFPTNWEYGEPFENFEVDYLEEIGICYERRN